MNRIHTITALALYSNLDYVNSGRRIVNRRTWGFFFDKAKAVETVEKNLSDIHEILYNYIVIESLAEGISPLVKEEDWFVFKNGHFIKTDRPKELAHTGNFAMG